jgi:cell fate regulator YaaT (PSP1 superfamily)
VYSFDGSTEPDLLAGDFVLVETSRGQQLGEVVTLRPPETGENNLSPVLRRATGRDLALRMEWQAKESEALQMAEDMAAEMRLPVKVAGAEYTFDGRQLTLLYVTEEKKTSIDRLVQRLERNLGVHVELRRVGPRDHAKLIGGYGACGEPRCCSRFLAEFTPVSIKMAKLQGVSLNPSEITGMCGRLRCCLTYEYEQYREICKALPRRKQWVRTPCGEGKVIDLLPLEGLVVVLVGDQRVEYAAEDVELVS